MRRALVDTDTLSQVIRGRDPTATLRANDYVLRHRKLAFSAMTRYEVLRGLKAKGAVGMLADFEAMCRRSEVLPITDEVLVRAADLYADLKRRGELIADADLIIAATALVHGLVLVTGNQAHFSRIPALALDTWTA